MRSALIAGMLTALALMFEACGATITVNSLADTGATGICVLRDAITAANSGAAVNGCAAGMGGDMINFSVVGTIQLASTLPEITDTSLIIIGPASPGITIDGGGKVGVMQVASGATVGLSNLTIANGADPRGGGWFGGVLNMGALTVSNSTFTGNIAEGGAGIMSVSGSSLTVMNSSFVSNYAFFGGGIDVEGITTAGESGTATVENSTFSANSGGGIFNTGSLAVVNSTFSANNGNNWAIYGGGISVDNGGMTTITNSTFSGNSGVPGDPLSFGNITVFDGTASLKNNILAHPVSAGNCSQGQAGSTGSITDLGYNISDDNSCGFSAIGSQNSIDPKLDPAGLANNGGPTQTIALLSDSPAIDTIPAADCTDQALPPNPIATDQRGLPRPDIGPAATTETVCDIGAYEFQDVVTDSPHRTSGNR